MTARTLGQIFHAAMQKGLEMLQCSIHVTLTEEQAGLVPRSNSEKVNKMVKNTQDYGAVFKDMMTAFPVDTKSMEGMMKNQSALAEKMSAVAIDAAQKSTDLSARWAQDTLTKLQAMTSSKTEPADYPKAMTDFMSASAEAAAEHMSAFAEIAKKVQTETLEMMMTAGKDATEDMTRAAGQASSEMTAAARKATK